MIQTPDKEVNGDQGLFGLMISEGSTHQGWEGEAEQRKDVDLVERMQRMPQEATKDRIPTRSQHH